MSRDDHLVAGAKPAHLYPGTQYQPEGIVAATDPHGAAGIGQGSQFALERLDLLAAYIPAAVDHTAGSSFKTVGIRLIGRREVKKRIAWRGAVGIVHDHTDNQSDRSRLMPRQALQRRG